MSEQRSAADYLPSNLNSFAELRKAAAKCRGCDLFFPATQTVFGAGSARAKILLIGEQPGDKEDLQGKPFVGPAGKLLDKALNEAGIDKNLVYVTNAVKHFKFEQRGKRRMHKKPKAIEINACRPWLDAEIAKLKPLVIVCMGATALYSIFKKTMKLGQLRGEFLQNEMSRFILVTIHPSAILRLIESEERHKAYELFVDDLRKINTVVKM